MGNDHDQETRIRVLKAAARIFAEHGFNGASVREICNEAGANVAAVNYHFRDKMGLYREVVQMAADAMESGKQAALDAGDGAPPEEQLRAYIRNFLQHILGEGKCWVDDLIGQEMAEPTPAFELIVKHGILPGATRLINLLSQIMGIPPEDARVQLSAASIQAQCLFYRTAKPVMAYMQPGLKFTPEVIEGIANHIAEFSLGGLRKLAQTGVEVHS